MKKLKLNLYYSSDNIVQKLEVTVKGEFALLYNKDKKLLNTYAEKIINEAFRGKYELKSIEVVSLIEED